MIYPKRELRFLRSEISTVNGLTINIQQVVGGEHGLKTVLGNSIVILPLKFPVEFIRFLLMLSGVYNAYY